MNRRTFLRSSAGAAAVLALSRCSPTGIRPRLVDRLPGTRDPAGCKLPAVRVSPDREIRTIAGLRPYRPSGFVVRAEKIGDAFIVHNYGHGGGGLTLSWGTSKLAVDMIPGEHRGSVAVLGCGAVGLATATLLQERGLPVTIYAKDLPPNTTSNVAGGQWFPFLVSSQERRTAAFMTQFVEASAFAYRRYQTLVGARYGVRWIRNYLLGDEPWSDTGLLGAHGPIGSCLPEVRDLTPQEHPFTGFRYVRQFDGMLIEPPIYLAAMLENVRMAGGIVRVREIAGRAELSALPERVIVNCTGLGSKNLFGDPELVPVKGQLTFLLPQPEIGYTTIAGELYMFPRSDGVLLGGTHEEGVSSLEPDPVAKERILAGHKRFFESFRRC